MDRIRIRNTFKKKMLLVIAFFFSCSLAFTQNASDKNTIFIYGQITDEQTGAPVVGQEIEIESVKEYGPEFQYNRIVYTDHEGFFCDTIYTNALKGAIKVSTVDFMNFEHDTTVYFRFNWSNENVLFPDMEIPIQNSLSKPQANFKIVNNPGGDNPLEYQFFDMTDCQYIESWSWNFGDGTFSYEQNPVHTYQNQGVYKVKLTITYIAYPFGNTVETFMVKVINVKYKSYFHFGGHVFAGYFPVDYGEVYLYKIEETKIVPIDTALYNDTLGYYLFYQLIEGNYFVKADLLPNSSQYNNFFPTYYSNKLFWQDADTISHHSNYYEYDIEMIPSNVVLSGPGSISGEISFGNGKNPACDIAIFLLDENGNPLELTHSDENGYFHFPDINFATYEVYAEMTGKNTIPVVLSLNASTPSFEEVQLFIKDNIVSGHVNAVQENLFSSAVSSVYPNPAVDDAFIDIESTESSILTVTLYNAAGQTIEDFQKTLFPGENKIQIDASNLRKGIYLMKINNGSNTAIRRFIKR